MEKYCICGAKREAYKTYCNDCKKSVIKKRNKEYWKKYYLTKKQIKQGMKKK